MFEQPIGKAEKDRSRTIIVASALAVLIVIVLIVVVSWISTRTQQNVELAMAGSSEFNAYTDFLKLEVVNKKEGERLHNNYVRFLCVVRNLGDKKLIGLQLRGVVIGFDGEVFKEKIFTPIPNQREALGPNESVDLDLYIEPTPDPAEISDIKIEISGLKLK